MSIPTLKVWSLWDLLAYLDPKEPSLFFFFLGGGVPHYDFRYII